MSHCWNQCKASGYRKLSKLSTVLLLLLCIVEIPSDTHAELASSNKISNPSLQKLGYGNLGQSKISRDLSSELHELVDHKAEKRILRSNSYLQQGDYSDVDYFVPYEVDTFCQPASTPRPHPPGFSRQSDYMHTVLACDRRDASQSSQRHQQPMRIRRSASKMEFGN
ncbi:hypothetical protein GUITHDRAFT_163804 [Guillardia theta CCMP2712]|uniref:Uncharacterized protein n=1 Tax=Guillardia theta (strain CCMP2712) TaxID=905079 RepID=L1J519_GUITC|nr:hypothetical protein GUITHDRAFT_163804 [Guillardia theta CCMP2712]EKX43606.1 hypothetical protein GUITHDRAFT_163804 [Guillardia theta CCMP2712]|eukprot:XP_005830586.1 hypothetical protein GUITHDRAFT_163804 [Guillardia theta CCMP2712]